MPHFTRILAYELRRILGRRIFYMALIILFMTLYSLSISTGGLSGTAPFSPPAIAGLLGMNGAIWGCMEILLCRDIFSERERAARRILLSAPISPAQYYAPKVTAAFLTTIALAGFSLLITGCSLWRTYGVFPLKALAVGFALFSLPSLLFVLGASLVLGRLHPGILYGFFFAALLFGTFSFPLPLWLDLFGNVLAVDISYLVALRSYAGEPLTAILPPAFLAGRVVFAAAGAIGLGAVVFRRVR